MAQHRKIFATVSLSALIAAGIPLPAPADAAVCTWNGGAGVWTPGGGWAGCVVPAAADDVIIAVGGSVVAINNFSANAGTVNLAATNQLNLSNSTLFIHNNAITNNGTINVASGSDFRSANGTVTIGGTGSIVLGDQASNRIFSGGFVFGSGQTVRGRGSIGLNQTIITNNGLISANIATQTLSLDVSGGSVGLGGGGVGTGNNSGLFNTGTMQASGGGILSFESGRYENSGTGVIQALAGSVVDLNTDARIVGGTLASVGTGRIEAINGTQYLTNVTLSSGSNIVVQGNNDLYLNTSFVNNGTVTVGGVAGVSSLRNEGAALAISGTGTIVLDSSAGTARIFGGNITFAINQSVRGAGQLGLNQTVITNNGLFSANAGSNLSIDVSGGSGGLGVNGVGTGNSAGLLNNSTIEATGNSRVSFESGLYENAVGGVIRATNNSVIDLNSDARILNGTLTSDATSRIEAISGTQYLTNVTLSAGSNIVVQGNNELYLNTSFVNNGTVTVGGVAGVAHLRNETPTLMISGTGTIVLDNSQGAARLFGGRITFGAGHTVRGAGELGLNQTVIVNNGTVSANTGTAISIDVSGGSGGLGGLGVGTDNNSGMLNSGTVRAINGSTVSFESGRYENSASGTLAVGTTGTIVMNNDANFLNLAGGVLNLGTYRSEGGTLNIRGAGASIGTIGTAAIGTDTVVTLSGAGSTLNALPISGGVAASVDSTLRTVARSGRLELLNGRSMTIVANGGNFSNAGIVQLGGGTFGAATYANTGETFGFGTISAPITNSGLVRANGGTLSTQAITGLSGTIQVDPGATLMLGGTSSAAFLVNNGTLALGTSNVTVNLDYTNAAFGAGNGFDGRANVSGTGLILAASATQDISGPDFSGGMLDLGSIRVGGATSTQLTITNNGTLTTLRGAVQNDLAPGVTISSPDFVLGPNGGSAIATVNFVGSQAGSLAGQTLGVVNNFDNVADATIGIIGAAYNAAVGALSPNPLNLGNFRIGDLASGVVTISNSAPAGAFSEGLRVVGTTPSANVTISGVPSGIIAAGSSGTATLGLSTALTGARSGTVAFDFVTDGEGTSGLAPAAIAGGSVTVNASVFALGNPIIADGLSFGNVLQGTVQTRSITVENRLLDGVLAAFQEGLNASFGAVSGDIVSALGSITNLAANSTDTTTLTVRLDTATAGAKGGLVQILLQSNGDGTSGLGLFDLASKTVTVIGTVDTDGSVFRLAQAGLLPTEVDFGNRRVGDVAPTQVLTISNLAAADGFSESLDAASGATTGRATASGGPIALLAAGNSSQAISVSIDTSVAGANGTLTIEFQSNGEGTSGLGITPLASQSVTLGGGVYQIAQAAAQPANIVLAARRVGDAAAASDITITNTAAPTGGYTEALSAEAAASAGFTANGASSATTSNLAPGAGQTVAIARSTGTAGAFAGTIDISNTSVAVAGTGLDNLALASQQVTVTANVYQAAIAASSGSSVDFGVVRQGDTAPMAAITITNAAAGDLNDTLETSVGATPAGISGSAPGALAAGASGDAEFTLDTSTAGVVAGGGSLTFVSSNAEMDDLALAPLALTFSGTVTDLAGAALLKVGGAGSLTGGGQAYVLDLGSFALGAGSAGTDLGVLNTVLASLFSESLGGGFSGSDGDGFSFLSADFANLAGGSTSSGNLLTFDYSSLGVGLYSRVYSFNGFSRFEGLADLALAPIQLTVQGRVVDGMGVIPEPGVWAQMIAGFGLIGGMIRRRRPFAGPKLASTVAA